MRTESEKMKSIDEVFHMCESRYALVGIVSRRAREIVEDATKRNEPLLEKPVNIVLNNLKSGKSTIVKPGSAATLYHDEDFDLSIIGDDMRIGEDISDNIMTDIVTGSGDQPEMD